MSKLRESAKGQQCTFNIPGACLYDTESVVLCHLPFEGGKMGGKSPDLSAAYGCCGCHDVIDRRSHFSISNEDREFFMRRANIRTLLSLQQQGLIKVAGEDF